MRLADQENGHNQKAREALLERVATIGYDLPRARVFRHPRRDDASVERMSQLAGSIKLVKSVAVSTKLLKP